MAETVAELLTERVEAAEYLTELVREFLRDGDCDVLCVISHVARDEWEKLPGEGIRRFPEGDLKVERVCSGVYVEWVPAP